CNYCGVLSTHQTIAVTGNLIPQSSTECFSKRLVLISNSRIEVFFKIGNTTLSIRHAGSAHAVDSASYTHTRLCRCIAEFFFHPLCAVSIDLFEAAFIRDKFCAKFPGGTAEIGRASCRERV